MRLVKILRILGLILIGFYVFARIHGFLWNYAAIEAQTQTSQEETNSETSVDFSLWDTKRIQAYKESLLKKFDPPLAVLRINPIELEVSVLEGTDEITLNRAVGHIAGTANISSNGNIGIAGHRDGFFRGLKDIKLGDVIEISTSRETRNYTVDKIVIVKPEDVWVLNPRTSPSITLVTCYPFYFIGHAPDRYIVQASLINAQSKATTKTP
jgi:sortase A